MSRKDQGFLWGRENVDYANLDHYQSALSSRNVQKEEYWYHSVFHAPKYAEMIVKEVYQQRLRQGEKRYSRYDEIVLTDDSNLTNAITDKEMRDNESSTQVSNDTTLSTRNKVFNYRLELLMILSDAVDTLSDDELLVLAYYLCVENLDSVLEHIDDGVTRKFRPYLTKIWNLPSLTWQSLYSLASRNRIDYARSQLRSKFSGGSDEI